MKKEDAGAALLCFGMLLVLYFFLCEPLTGYMADQSRRKAERLIGTTVRCEGVRYISTRSYLVNGPSEALCQVQFTIDGERENVRFLPSHPQYREACRLQSGDVVTFAATATPYVFSINEGDYLRVMRREKT